MALKARIEPTDRLGKIAVVLVLEHVDERLRVGIGGQRVARGGDLRAEVDVILKDAVHQDAKAAVLRKKRVRVALFDDAVGRPAGVPHADGRGGREPVRDGPQSFDGTDGTGALETGVADQHHSGRVVAAVLEMLEAR